MFYVLYHLGLKHEEIVDYKTLPIYEFEDLTLAHALI